MKYSTALGTGTGAPIKILILSYHFPPLNNVAALRPLSFALTFASMGHDVTVVTGGKPLGEPAKDHYPFKVITVESALLTRLFALLKINRGSDSSASRPARSKAMQRLNKLRTRRGLLILGRMPDLLDLLIRPTTKALGNRQWDLVISSYAPRYCHAVAKRLKSQNRVAFWVADYRDLWSIHHQFKGLFPFTKLEQRLDRTYLESADLVTTVSDELRLELKEITKNVPVEVVTNGFDLQDASNLKRDLVFQGDKLTLVYTGTTYPSWGSFKHFLLAVKHALAVEPSLAEKVQIYFIGSDLAGLEQRALRQGVSKMVNFWNQRPREFALRCQRDASVLLFFDPNKSTGISTGKIYEYISSGTTTWRIGPPNNTSALKILRKTNSGIDIGNDEQEIGRKIVELARSKRKPDILPYTRAVMEYERNTIARRLLSTITQMAPQLGDANKSKTKPNLSN